jgi:hypothetical protein
MIPPPEDLSPVPQDPPSILGRIGQRAANAPSDILNDLMRLSYNVGFKDPDQTEAPQVPIPYDVPQAQTTGESLVDIGANLAESLPLFASGEGIGSGVARLAKAGPVAAKMLRYASGFGIQGLSESPEHGAIESALGAGYGAAEALPGPLRYLAALGVGAGTYANLKGEGASDRQAGIMGIVQSILPLITHRPIKQAITREVPPMEGIGDTHGPFQPGYGFNIGLTERSDLALESQPTGTPPVGSLIREPIYSEGEANRIATLQQRPPAPLLRLASDEELPFVKPNGESQLPASTRVQATTEQPLLPLGGPNGSLIRDPIMTMAEMRRGRDVQPPEGSLIREPAITMGEARAVIAARTPVEGKVIPFEEPAAPTAPEPKPSNRLLLSSVLSHEDTTLAEKAAKKLGLEFKGVQDNAGRYPNQLYFNLTTPGRETTISLESGKTYKDLKNQVLAKNREYDAKETAAAVRDSEAVKKVATLQQESIGASPETAAATSPPSSLETALVPESQLPHGLKYGDKALIYEGGEKIVATLQPGVEAVKPIRAIGPKGEVFDRLPSEIKPLGFSVKQTKADIESVGGLQDLEKLGTEQQQGSMKMGGGKMKLSNFGEHGFLTPEAQSLLVRYGVMPAVGGAVGYAEDDQHRASSAIIGAVIGGSAGYMGGKILKLITAHHPPIKPGSGTRIAAMKKLAGEDTFSFVKAVAGNEEMAIKAAREWNLSSAYDKLAHWVRQNVGTVPYAVRMIGKAYGVAEDLAQNMNDALKGLKNINLSESQRNSINQYFLGQINHASLETSVSKEAAALAANAIKARTELQNIVLDGLGAGKLSTAIQNSIGKYLTTTYRIFHEPTYKPTSTQIEAAARSLEKIYPGETLERRIDYINEYLNEIGTNRKLYGLGSRGETLKGILSRQKDLTPEFKDMLGQYDNPIERMAFTGMKLVNGARSAEFFNEVARGVKENGLRFAYSAEERQAAIATLQHESQYNFTPEARAAAKAKLDEVQGYVLNPSGASNGRLSGKYLDLGVRDQLANYDASHRMFRTQFTRTLADITNIIKYNKVVASPLQLVRQVVQLPILGMLARTNPGDWLRANSTLWNTKTAEGLKEISRLRRMGVIGGDQVGGMLRRDMEAMMNGSLGAKLNAKFKEGMHKWEEIWRTPDLIVRVSAFQRKEAELLAKGVAPDLAANQAIDHMNRYTMNYGAVPPIVAKGRQLPFINQFLSWTYETLRITKNYVEDAKKGDPYAIGVLATVATAPFLIQSMSEAALSPEDRKAWDRVKDSGPTYNRYNFKFVSGRLPSGEFRYHDFTPLVIHDQLMRMIRSMMAGDTAGVMSSNPVAGWEDTPMLNVAATLVTGRNRYSGDKLNNAADYANSVWKEVAPTILSTEVERLVKAITPNDQGGIGTIDARTGQVNSLSDMVQKLHDFNSALHSPARGCVTTCHRRYQRRNPLPAKHSPQCARYQCECGSEGKSS